jgi:high-affinity iron transporter
VYGTLSRASQVLFEGVAALIAVAVLTSMIYWMAIKGRAIKREVEGRVERAVTQGAIIGLVSLTFILVFREGLETVLFLTPTFGVDPTGTLVGAALGVLAGTLLAYGVFKMGLKLDLRKFFFLTSLLLILIAGGLLGYGVHELIEYGEIQGSEFGWWGEAAYTLPIAGDSVLHHRGAVGSIFAVMFGYTVSAEWARVIAHAVYLAVALPLVVVLYQRPEWVTTFLARVRSLLRRAPSGAGQGP